MCTKLVSALLVSAALCAPGVALADPPDKCPIFTITTPGDFNKLWKETWGPPGQNTFLGIPPGTTPLPPNEAAAFRNERRAIVCPPPGK
jgi:hypothetical protein